MAETGATAETRPPVPCREQSPAGALPSLWQAVLIAVIAIWVTAAFTAVFKAPKATIWQRHWD
jgi:hypothetical protein